MGKSCRFNKNFSVHFIIVGGFILYLLLANYIFDRMLSVRGEAKLQRFDLPKDTNKIVFGINKTLDSTKSEWKELVSISGWAFVEGRDAINNSVYIVLESQNNAYIFDTGPVKRPDVTDALGKKAHLNLENSGFRALICKSLIENGRYEIGIYIRNDNGEFFAMGNEYVTKDGDSVFRGIISIKQQGTLPEESQHIKYNIGKIKEVIQQEQESIHIVGWAFVKGQDAINNNVYVVLQSGDRTYIFDTVSMKRRGVTDVFGKRAHLNLDNSGFQAYISRGLIENGRYNIGIYIRNNNGEFFTMGKKYVIEVTTEELVRQL